MCNKIQRYCNLLLCFVFLVARLLISSAILAQFVRIPLEAYRPLHTFTHRCLVFGVQLRRSTLMWDLEFGDLLVAGISGEVGRDVRSASVYVNRLAASFLHLHIMKASSDLIRLDLHCFGA